MITSEIFLDFKNKMNKLSISDILNQDISQYTITFNGYYKCFKQL